MNSCSLHLCFLVAFIIAGLLKDVQAKETKSECVDGTLFTVVTNDDSDFSTAKDNCLDKGSVLASIRNKPQFAAVIQTVQQAGSKADEKFWVGLEDNGNGKNGTERFKYVDQYQKGIKFIHVAVGTFPWADNQPDDNQQEENCTLLSERLFDEKCTNTHSYVCSTDCTPNPTSIPTAEPTTSPTNKPTGSPTNSPTGSPTNKPTGSPTNSPTESPTEAPTKNPTTSPTRNPTKSPTRSPTLSPTNTAPTLSPTSKPTENPTLGPTSAPTLTVEAADSNIGAIVGVVLPLALLGSVLAMMVIRREDIAKRFGKDTKPASNDTNEPSNYRSELMTDFTSSDTVGFGQGRPSSKPQTRAGVALSLDPTTSVTNTFHGLKNSKPDASKGIGSPSAISSETLKRLKQEKADEEAFEALMANNGKTPKIQLSKEDEAELDAILGGVSKNKAKLPGKKQLSNNPNFNKSAFNEARPQSAYLKSAEINKNRRSIFRPSSAFLSKAQRDKAMRKQKEEMEKKKQRMGSFDIDNDI